MRDQQRGGQKSLLRQAVLAARSALGPAARAENSRKILAHLSGLPVYQRAAIIHTYMSLPEEVETHTLILSALAAGKRIVLPGVRVGSPVLQHYFIRSLDDLRPGIFKILEPDPKKCVPADPAAIDLILVPGIAFDLRGNRLGFGKGFYDRFLMNQPAPCVGLAFAVQIVPHVPVEPWDVPVDALITETGVQFTGRRQLAGLSDSGD